MTPHMNRQDEIRQKALKDLQRYEVLMLDGHFDFGNGYHGRVYLNPHQLFRQPSTIWRFTQDLIDVLPGSILEATEVVAGPATGGALLAHTIAGLLDSRRELPGPRRCLLHSPVTLRALSLSRFYQQQVKAKRAAGGRRPHTGHTLSRCAGRARRGRTLLATAEIYDRSRRCDLDVPNVALASKPENYPVGACPLCAAGTPVIRSKIRQVCLRLARPGKTRLSMDMTNIRIVRSPGRRPIILLN